MKDNIHSLYDDGGASDPLWPHLAAFLAMILSCGIVLGLLWSVLTMAGTD